MGLSIKLNRVAKLSQEEAQSIYDTYIKHAEESSTGNDLSPEEIMEILNWDYILVSDYPEIEEVFKDRIVEILMETTDVEKITDEYKFTEDDIETCSIVENNMNHLIMNYVLRDKRSITVDIDNYQVKKLMKTIFVEGKDLEYLAKGANAKFYKDGNWGSRVLRKKDLIDHLEKYFSDEFKPYNLTAEENRTRFQTKIIDKFVEGEMIVKYS